MNYNNSKYDYIRNDFRTKKIRLAKDIKQAWYRRFSQNIHSGVRVKVKRKNSLFIQPIHHELKSLEIMENSSQNQSLISIFNNNFLRKNHSLEKDKNLKSFGIQTIMITQIDRQTSCNLIKTISRLIQNSRSSSSISKTSISNENSTHTDSTSTETSIDSSTTSDTNENDDHNPCYRRNKNLNKNAIDTDIEQNNKKEFKMEKAITHLLNNKQSLQDINNNTQCYPQITSTPVSSAGKKRFFDTFLNVISFIRLSSFKHERVRLSTTTIGTSRITDVNRNEINKNIRSPTSRCRRSAARNCNYNSSIEPEKYYFQIRSEEDSTSKRNHLEQKASIHTVSDIPISTRKQCRQTNNSSLSISDSYINRQKNRSHRSKKKSSETTQQKRSHRKKQHKYLHRKKQKHIHKSNQSYHSQQSSQLNTLLNPSIVIKNQPLSSVDDKSKPVDNLSREIIEDKKYFSPPTDSIRLRIKNKNLSSNLSKSKILFSSIYPMNNSIQHHQTNIGNEFKSILQQTKNIHIN